jgi:hypothetical protein
VLAVPLAVVVHGVTAAPGGAAYRVATMSVVSAQQAGNRSALEGVAGAAEHGQ